MRQELICSGRIIFINTLLTSCASFRPGLGAMVRMPAFGIPIGTTIARMRTALLGSASPVTLSKGER